MYFAGSRGNSYRSSYRRKSSGRSYGSYHRYGRSVEDHELFKTTNDLFAQADLQDLDDCAKMFICELNAKDKSKLSDMEIIMKDTFGVNGEGKLDVTQITAKFDFAAVTGQMAGLSQCKKFYGRCQIPYDQMKTLLDSTFYK